ncbi:hypothetical protein BD410DRAFT_833168 [Rickenella mellea]|uniref:Lysine-specific metallo-endopeptidase domain-containing protein n=1 Tax=Rickenella mellea TaxID=50990 RepID=A0A4Y7PGF4_9AGAM|nr:hypothetical protein BD410DRAFT_833168 [Rickenella mellea]
MDLFCSAMKFTLSCSLGLVSLICASNTSAVPLLRRIPLTLQVLNDSLDNRLGCSAAQIATLRDAITDVITIAARAATVLGSPNVENTTVTDLAADIPPRLTNVVNGLSKPLNEITVLAAGNTAQTLRFFCPAEDATEEEGNPCSKVSDAVTTNLLGELGARNTIALCPSGNFFAGVSRESDRKSYNDVNKLTSFNAPRNPGHILIHEAQHSIPLAGGSNDDFIIGDVSDDAKPTSCVKLNKMQRAFNAENWALVTFLIDADPDRFKPPAPSKNALATTAVITTKSALPSSSKSAVATTAVTPAKTASVPSVVAPKPAPPPVAIPKPTPPAKPTTAPKPASTSKPSKVVSPTISTERNIRDPVITEFGRQSDIHGEKQYVRAHTKFELRTRKNAEFGLHKLRTLWLPSIWINSRKVASWVTNSSVYTPLSAIMKLDALKRAMRDDLGGHLWQYPVNIFTQIISPNVLEVRVRPFVTRVNPRPDPRFSPVQVRFRGFAQKFGSGVNALIHSLTQC